MSVLDKVIGRIIEVEADIFRVESGGVLYDCKARGIFRKKGVSPVAGDFAEIEPLEQGGGLIHSILERENSLQRPAVANVDRLVIVVSVDDPAPVELFIDKLTIIAENAGIPAVIVVNKTDLGEYGGLFGLYRGAGYKVFGVCAADGRGIEELRRFLNGGLSVFCGFSGVGKSSLLNRLLPGQGLSTGDVSPRLKKGRHTTRRVSLLPLPGGGYAADTPGFSSLDILRYFRAKKEDLAWLFRDFRPFLGKCRFAGCAHLKEKDCAVLEALQNGGIARSRYESYAALYRELKNVHDWQ